MSMAEHEMDVLEDYSSLARSKTLASQSDLNPNDRAMPEMLAWCRNQKSLVVLQNSAILCSDPSARVVQNCKIVMRNLGMNPGPIYSATQELISILLENAEEITEHIHETLSVSAQQQRLRMLVKEALEVDATDIHIEVRQDNAKIRFRKHGELFLHAQWLPRLAREIASVAFNKETDHSVTHFNPLIPQSASMPLQIENRIIRLRLSSLPAHGGFDVVMRLFTTGDEKILALEHLGYEPDQIELIYRALQMPAGAVIVAGPTGSGKTTTLASCMRLISEKRKVYTIEDPVEKLVNSATQVPANTEHDDRNFASMARTVLRMDPDVVVLGEMRDEETVQVMIRAAMTGHLVFSTVHSNTAMGIIPRMMDLGISSAVLASPNLIVALICQRLAPILCEQCKWPLSASSNEALIKRWELLLGNIHSVFLRGTQCAHCQNLGISTRRVVSEIIWLDDQDRDFIHHQNLQGWKKYLEEKNISTYRDQLLKLVSNGLCDPEDAERMVGYF